MNHSDYKSDAIKVSDEVVEIDQATISVLIDSSPDKYREFCSQQTYGYLCGLENLMTMQFNRASKMKADLISLILKYTESSILSDKERAGAELNLKGMYKVLMNLEHKVFITREVKKSKRLN